MVRKNSKISDGIKLKLNVNVMQQYVTSYIQRNEIYYEPKKKETKPDEAQEQKNISCSSSFIALTRLVEVIVNDIVNNTLPKCKKDNFGLNVMSYDAINCSIITDQNLHNNYYKYTINFNSGNNYIAELAQYNYIKEFIDSNYEKLMIERKGSNFLSFIVISILNEILYIMTCIIKYTHKSCFTIEMVSTVCSIIFKDNLKSLLIQNIDETDKLYKQYKEKLKEEAAKKKEEEETKKAKEIKDENTENKNEESKNEESKNEESKNEESKNEESKNEESKNEENKNEENKNEESKNEESKEGKNNKKEEIKKVIKKVNKINKIIDSKR